MATGDNGVSVELVEGMTLGDLLGAVYGFTNSTASFNNAYFSSIIVRDTIVKEDISFTVTFNNGGGTGTAVTYTYSDKGALATSTGLATGTKPEASFSKTGHTFAGWATTNGATTAVIASAGALSTALTNITNGGAYTLYAVWTPNPITVTYDQNKPTGVTANPTNWPANPTGITYGGSVTIPSTAPTLSGYTFNGYNTAANGSGTAYQPGATISNITAALTLYAQWTAWPTITYNGNGSTGGTVPAAGSAAPNTTYTIATGTPTRTGYTFGGWATTTTGTGTKYSYNGSIAGTTGVLSVGTSNITLYAVWNPAVTFNENKPAGALASTAVSGMPSAGSATAGTAYTLPANTPTLQGYTFAGWKINNAGNTLAAGASAGVLSAATTFYAQWTEKSGYSVTFYANSTAAADGTAHATQSNLNWTSSVSVPTAPSKTGYTFGGWYFVKDTNGSGTGTQVMVAATAFNSLWEAAKAAGAATDSTTALKLYAKWTEKDRVTFTLNPNGGTYNGGTAGYTESNILNGGSFTIPSTSDKSNPTRVGYNFKGWAENAAGTGTLYQAGAVFNNLTASKTLYAAWEAAQVTFTFEPGATSGVTAVKGSNPYTMTANYGSNLAVPAGTSVYTRTGFNFSSWGYTNSSNVAATVVAAGASVPVSSFKIAWTGDSAAGTLKGTAVLTANWGAFTYTIAWNTQGGNTIASTTGVQPTTSVTLPATPTRSGYTFKGWNTAAAGTGTAVSTGSIVNATWDLSTVSSGGTLTAYAQWEENKVQIRFFGDTNANVQYGDGSALANGQVVYVGAATGAIYASASATTPTTKNISVGVMPSFINTNYEYNAAHGSKWTIGSATGTQVAAANVSTAGLLTVPTTGGLYTNADYYLTVSPKWIAYTVEYYTQNTTGTGYTKVTTPAGSGTAPFGYSVEAGATAGTNDTTKTVTFVRSDITGFTYNASAAGSVNRIVMSATAADNVIKLYFDRNTYTVSVSYSGDVPDGMIYTPATQTKRYGETVSLTTPTAPTGYTWEGWTLVSGTGVTASQVKTGSFVMPTSNLVIEGVWSKVKYNAVFKTNTTYGAALVGTTSYSLEYGDHLSALPTANPKDANQYYFMGWQVYEGCTTSGSESTGTLKGTLSPDAILGTGDVGTPWTISSHTVFVAQFGLIITINYTSGAASNAFAQKNGAQTGNTITQYGTRYSNLQSGWTLPVYGGTVNATGDRNAGNPTAAPGYKFVGWEWFDALQNKTLRVEGYYTGTDATRVFHKTSGDDLPTTINQSITFTALWEETTQHLHFDNNVANISGLTGTGATDTSALTGQTVALPQNATYKSTTNPTAYTLLGWTTDATYVNGTSPLYTTSFTMTAGTQNNPLYSLGDAYYGVTLYPVFRENTVTITYTYATGSSASMGTLSNTTEGTSFAMVTGTPKGSKPTAGTGHTFLGWFTDAAHTIAVPASWVAADGTLTPQKVNGVYAAATYYAAFEAEQYTITFMVGDATNVAHGSFSDGTTANKIATITYNNQYGTNVPATKADKGYGFVSWKNVATGTTYSAATLATLRATGDATYVAIWEPRSGYTIAYETNGGSPTLASQQTTWTAVLNDVMTNDAKTGMYRQGYTFAGWYAKQDLSDASKIGTTTTFQQGIDLAGITVGDDDTATLTLYAKWIAREITVHFQPRYPDGNTATIADKTITWTDKNLLGANATLSASGYTFTKWSTTNAASGMTVDNNTLVSAIYQALYGTSDNTKTEITLYGIWDQKTFTVKFQDSTGHDLKTIDGLTWTDSIDYYSYAPSDGSQRLLGWTYTPAGGSLQTWIQSAGKLAVSAFDGTPTPADGSTFILTAKLEDNTKYVINFNKVNVDANGNVNMSSSNTISSTNGFATPGVAIDITNFNTHNYVTEFENQNGAGRRTDLKGYELNEAISKLTSTVAEATAGGTITFNVYWVEKIYTITYDAGKDAFGNAAPSTIVMPADKQASWNSSNILPDTTPTWEGYKAPKWQYRNSAGQLVTLPAGATVADIALTDDNTTPITLYALWESDTVRITYAVQTGGTANNAAGSFLITGPSSKYQDIDAVNGTPYTMTAAASTGYKFVGWYKDGVLLTTDLTMTPEKDGDLFSTSTYEARFTALGDIQYTIQHFFQGLDGTYTQNTSLDDTRSGEEFSRVTVSNDMIKTVKGFTYMPGITGSVEVIESLTGGQILKLFYERNAYDVWVTPSASGADAPTPVPTPTYTSTGITQAHTNQKFGESLVLPTITAPSGWNFTWTVSYTEPGFAAVTTQLGNGATFTMPAAEVNIIGTWTRLGHNVYFVAGNGHGTVNVNGATLPFTVDHGKTLNDPSATGNAAANITVTADNEWAFAGWSYVDAETGETKTTRDPDSVIILGDTTFTALWAQTFAVVFHPGAHGGTGFTSAVVAGEDIEAGTATVDQFPLIIGGQNVTANAPAATGFEFVGWTWVRDGQTYYWLAPGASYTGAGIPGTMDFEIRGNVDFTALWAAGEQDLIYKLDTDVPQSYWTPGGVPGLAGTTGSEYTTNPRPRTDEVVTLLSSGDVAREGYSLRGWAVWTDSNNDGVIDAIELGNVIAAGGTFKMPANKVILVPVWDFESLQIKYEIATGSTGLGTISNTVENITDSTMQYAKGSVATAKPGYTFDGWYTDAACTTKVPSSRVKPVYDDDFNLVGYQIIPAQPLDGWVPVTYYAKFVATNTGYKVEYYFQNADGSYSKRDDLTVNCTHLETGDIASVTDPTNHAYNYKLDMTQFPGYVFDEGVYGSVLTAVVNADGSTTLKLYHSNVPFNIDYVLGTNDEGEAGKWTSTPGRPAAIGGSTITIPGVTLEGMKHAGWEISYVDPTTGDTKTSFIGVNDSFTMPLADVVATAIWAKVVDVTIEYIKDNGERETFDTQIITAPGVVGDSYTIPSELINSHRPAGYKWNGGNVSIDKLVAGDNLIQVIYEIVKDYKVIFNANTGTKTETVGGYTVESIVADKQTHPTKPGYTLAGWSTKANGSVELTADMTYAQLAELIFGKFDTTNDEQILRDGLTVYAVWTENGEYKVIYDLNNDKNTNSTILKPVPDTRNPFTPDPIENVKWTQSGFNLFSDAELDAAPAGYEFAGWNTQRDGKGLTITDATKYLEMSNAIDKNNPQASITLYAMWKEIIIKIEYTTNGEGGTVNRVIDNVSAVTGQHVGTGSSAGDRLHSVATAKPGYHFVRWELVTENTSRLIGFDENGWHTIQNDNSEIVVEEPGEDGRLVAAKYMAIFEKNADATINYDVNGGEGEIPSTTTSYGLNVNLHNGTGIKRGHYTLVGWNTEADGTGTAYKLGQGMVMPEGGLNLYAMWEVDSYKVNVSNRHDGVADVNGGSTKVEWGQPLPPEYIASISQTPKPGSTFQGWHYTMTDADTGEVIEGVVWDLSELTVLGPIEIEALYETEDIVTEGTTLPKTSDEFGLMGLILAIALALVALVIFLIAIVRRRNDEDDTDPQGPRATRRAAFDAIVLDRIARVENAAHIPPGMGVSKAYGLVHNLITPGMRNGRMNNASPRRAGVVHAYSQTRLSRVAAPHTAGSFFVWGSLSKARVALGVFAATLVLVCTLAFAPGLALAATGDPGSGAAGTGQSTQSNTSTQSHHTNADPATTQTGSFKSKSVTSATSSSSAGSVSAQTASKSAARATSAASAASPRSAETSAAPQVSASYASSSASSCSSVCSGTTSASRDEITRLTVRNSLAHKASSSAASTRLATANAQTASSTASTASTSARAGVYATYASSSQGSTTSAQASLLTASSASPSAAVQEAPNVVATASLGARASNTTSPASSIALVGDIAVSSASVLAGSGSAVAVSGSATANARPVSASSLAASYARMAPVATFAATPSLLSAAASGAPPDTSFDDVSDEASGGSSADVPDASETPGETGDSTSDPNENVENSDPETPTGPVDPDPAEPAEPDPVDPFDPLEPADPDPADPVDPSEPVIPTEPETPVEKPCTYVLTFDMNGGAFSGDTYKPASPSNCTVGKDEVLINTAALTKEGHEFLCWNTDASGKGVPIRDGETLSADILRAMLIETASDGADGSTIQLYAQWNATGTQPVLIDTEVPDVSTTPNAPVVSLPSQNFSTNQTASVLGSAANRTPTVRTSSAFDAAPEAAEATDPLAEALDIIADTENALVPLPPALEVLPAAAEEFTTLSAEALAGLEDTDGFLGWIASMTPAEATQAAGTALAAAGVVALLASVAGAASSSLARRRVERTGAPNANTQD